jgi:hypothetical protein
MKEFVGILGVFVIVTFIFALVSSWCENDKKSDENETNI